MVNELLPHDWFTKGVTRGLIALLAKEGTAQDWPTGDQLHSSIPPTRSFAKVF